MAKRWLVVGGGFRGIVGAYLLASAGHDVVLIDSVQSSSDLGGVLSSALWKGFYLDKGCHLFANTNDKITTVIMGLLGEEKAHPVPIHYASVTNGKKTDGFAIPDLNAYGKQASRDILYELLEVVSEPSAPREANLQERLNNRYGMRAGQYLAAAFSKMYQVDPADIAPEALSMTPFQRIHFIEDRAADILKESPKLDERVASSSQSDPMRFWRDQAQNFSFREFYPREHGMRGFCEQAAFRLQELGVSFQLGHGVAQLCSDDNRVTLVLSDGQQVDGEQVLWTSGIENLEQAIGLGDSISVHIHCVPTILYYFVIQRGEEGPYTYIQDFDEKDLIFRASVPGSYGMHNCPEGLSYLCAEISTKLSSPELASPQEHSARVWKELQKYDVVRCEEPVDTLSVKVPISYKLPKVSYWDAAQQIFDNLKHDQRIAVAEQWKFTKHDIIRSLQELVEQV